MIPGLEGGAKSFAALRQFVQNPARLERCGICRTPVPENHPHLVDLESRALVCSCRACSLLFGSQSTQRYRSVPRNLRRLPELQRAEETWEGLSIPINMAFLFYNSKAGQPVAVYPSPAGGIESSIPAGAWEELISSSFALGAMEPDVEALLVNRLGATPEYYIAPIDECHKLVGLVRVHWRGLAGGNAVWRELENFFADLGRRAANLPAEVSHA